MAGTGRHRYSKGKTGELRDMSKDSSVDSFIRNVYNYKQLNDQSAVMFDDQSPGPDTYNVMRDLIAKKQQIVSRYKNEPSFPVFSRSDKHNKTVITSGHKVDKLGKDSPGVGLYDTSAERFYKFKK